MHIRRSGGSGDVTLRHGQGKDNPKTQVMNCDILIIALPVSALNYAPAAPALLKACVEQIGFKARTLDLSQSFLLENSRNDFLQYDEDTRSLQPNNISDPRKVDVVQQWLSNSVDKIKEINPKYVGLSIFSYFMHRSAFVLAERLRKDLKEVKIILGGFGMTQPASSLFKMSGISNLDSIINFNVVMKEKGLCDYFIVGEGEEGLTSFLLDEKRLTESDVDDDKKYKAPISDFSDYDLQNYNYVNTKILPITGSKGCVRKCTFCDIPSKFGRFRYRSGRDIALEIFELKEKYGINHFSFTDSLINGSLSALEEMTIELAEHNNKNPDDKIRWDGQYISRPKGQTPERIYRLMAESGAEGLTIGLESGSNDVLEAMNKKVRIEDVDWEMEIFDKYRISSVVLLMFGFYNETEEDFLKTINTIIRYQKYVANGTLIRMELGFPLAVTGETALYTKAHELGIKIHDTNPLLWTAKNNPTLDFKQRIRRRLVAQVVCDELNIPTGLSAYNLTNLLNTIDGHQE